MKIIIAIFYIALVPIFCFPGDQDNNLEWIEKNIDSILDSIKISEITNLNNTKLEFGAVHGEQIGFIKNKIIKYLEEKKNQPNSERSDKIFKVEQFNTEIVYQENSTGFLNLEIEYTRINYINFDGWIEDTNGKIFRSFKVKKTVTDSITVESISSLEKGPYSFTRGKTKNLAIWSTLIEPILIGGTVGLMVYLLFSVRS